VIVGDGSLLSKVQAISRQDPTTAPPNIAEIK
jgi:hypothetical protein